MATAVEQLGLLRRIPLSSIVIASTDAAGVPTGLTGAAGSRSGTGLADRIAAQRRTSLPPAGKAAIRVMQSAAVEVAVRNEGALIWDLRSCPASSYLTVEAGTYDIEVRTTGSTADPLHLPGITLRAGKIYTVYGYGDRSLQG